MRQAVIWFFLSCKRYLKRLSFLLILLFFPIAAGLFARSEKADQKGVVIGVFSEDSDEGSLGMELARKLEAYGDGMFSFCLYDSGEELTDAVAARQVECGYVIGEGLKEKMDSGDYRRLIRVYRAPSTIADEMSKEVVYSLLAGLYDREILTEYIGESQVFDYLDQEGERKEGQKRGGELYDAYASDGSTFHFEYEKTNARLPEESGETSQEKETLFPARGLAAVLVFTAGIYGGASLKRDEKNGLFLRLPFGKRELCRIASLAAPAGLAALSGLAAIGAAGIFVSWRRELLGMFLYVIGTAVYARILSRILPTSRGVSCLLPFFIIGSLVFCPVLIDVGQFVPQARAAGWIFLPWYYLKMF